MPTIYCIGGVSGSGKTHYRKNDPGLSRLSCIDIADIYDEYPCIGREAARLRMLDRLESHMQYHDTSIVLEAFFAPGRLQRKGVEDLADRYDFKVRYFWCAAPRDVCYDRIQDDYDYCYNDYDDYEDRHQARLDFVNSAPEKYFYAREREEPPRLMDACCQDCDEWPYEAPACTECGDDTCGPLCVDCADDAGLVYFCCSSCNSKWSRRRSRHRNRGGYH